MDAARPFLCQCRAAMDGNMETKMNSKSKAVFLAAFAVALLAVPISSYAAQQQQAKQVSAKKAQAYNPNGGIPVGSIFSKVVDLSTRARPRTSRTISRLIIDINMQCSARFFQSERGCDHRQNGYERDLPAAVADSGPPFPVRAACGLECGYLFPCRTR